MTGIILAIVGDAPAAKKRVYRNDLSIAGAVGSALLALILLWLRDNSLYPIAAALLLLLAARMLLVRVEARTNGLRIVNPYRTYRISWSDISGFQMGRHVSDEGGSSPVGFVVRREGEPIGMFGVGKEHQVEELNAMLGQVH